MLLISHLNAEWMHDLTFFLLAVRFSLPCLWDFKQFESLWRKHWHNQPLTISLAELLCILWLGTSYLCVLMFIFHNDDRQQKRKSVTDLHSTLSLLLQNFFGSWYFLVNSLAVHNSLMRDFWYSKKKKNIFPHKKPEPRDAHNGSSSDEHWHRIYVAFRSKGPKSWVSHIINTAILLYTIASFILISQH